MIVDAVYENGVLRPLQPLDLPEHERVTVCVTKIPGDAGEVDVEFIDRLRDELHNADPAPGREEVRRRLAKIPGSMAADFVEEREDR